MNRREGRGALLRILSLVAGLALAGATPAVAWVEQDTWEVEVAFGAYQPDPDVLDNDVVFGVRAGTNFTQRFNLQTGLTRYDVSTPSRIFLPQVQEFELEYEAVFLDVALGYQLTPKKRWVTVLFLGPGYAAISADVNVTTSQLAVLAENLDGSSFTVNAGAAGKVTIGEKMYVGVMGRARWIADRRENELDQEWTASLGIVF